MHKLAAHYGDAHGLADWSKIPDLALKVPALLAHCAEHFADHELSVFDDRRLTYNQASERSAVLARQLLDAGIGKGSRVGMIFANSPEFVVTWLAITRIGAIAVPISTLSTAAELARIIRHADLQLLISVDQFLNHDYVERLEVAFDGLSRARAPFALAEAPYLRDIWIWGSRSAAWATLVDLAKEPRFGAAMLPLIEAEVSPADIVSIIYTSGSTADPKGVIHSHGAFMRQAAKLAATYPYRGDDRTFTPMPFFWVGGLTLSLLNAMHVGSTMLGSAKTGAALLDFLERERATYVFGWPHMMRALAADPSFSGRDFSAMRGGGLVEALPAAARPRNQIFGHALGMTETSGPHTISPPDIPEHLTSSFGPPMPGMEHKIVDVDTGLAVPSGEIGELLVRGDAVMQGMVKHEREEVFEPDGWYRTRDLCSFREGHLFFHGRADDLIKASGANVSPQEVENALTALPGVAQAIVLSVPDEQRGAVVGAVVVAKPNATLDAVELGTAAAKSLSVYKVPRIILPLEPTALPMTSSGKVDRRKLVEMLHQSARKG